mmetsp:Transcript_8232/g.12396  ORF Transcript_8232/g.12396 Transcript_8232/m.12396 type:complete len:517 (+) Transcript_8232:101-1651(+)|eukprot:CAMPEP_0203674212 /NCGR_PEP_ID=MMETSP0090-20130426/15286_1 /ASSEMBLY_ACC=CAM_ASM_001088 /TAXON_ID=426623 /ORGANISM="Chaetoceros affinis, Strain CCMP159" /LENGTH=516 /DNA_ID=CAMNT_0050540023 /DNA_START=95 /DNA_END=1645 /DNA_ORIENTATION=+
MSTSSLAAAAARYGKLWGRGHETFPKSLRRILSVKGKGQHPTKYLQGLVTCDLQSEPRHPREVPLPKSSNSASNSEKESDLVDENGNEGPPPVEVEFTSKMRSACFLDQKGRVLTDAILWKFPFGNDSSNEDIASKIGKKDGVGETNEENTYLIDVPGDSADLLLDHLKKYKLRRTKVQIDDVSDDYSVHCVYGTLNAKGTPPGYAAAIDPRHPSLGMRVLSYAQTDHNQTHEERAEVFAKMMSDFFPKSNGTYSVIRKLAGVAEGSEINGRTALECNQEFLNAVAFDKGCYLGQELTARSQHTGTIRKRILPILIVDTSMEIPRPWILASKIQDMGVDNLNADIIHSLGMGLEVEGELPPVLPKISASGVGGVVAMVQGNLSLPTINASKDGTIDESQQQVEISEGEREFLKKLQSDSALLLQDLENIAVPGAKIIDQKDGKAIGQIISSPASGTPVVLAQMRLDQVGLLKSDNSKWSQTNKIKIGDGSKEYRYLPYIPIWWPEINLESGKEKLP